MAEEVMRSKPGYVRGPWSFEVLAMMTSIATLLAIVAILATINGKRLSSWHSELRPNTIVAILSTASKSSLLMVLGQGIGQLKWVYFEQRPQRIKDFELFDDASRGPYGSSRLSLCINWRASMASVGAMLTLLALAMDPFVQQVISYEPVLMDTVNLNSTVGITRAYDTQRGLGGYGVSYNDSSLSKSSAFMFGSDDVGITGAVYRAVFSNLADMPTSCPSGNCAWKEFESLGFCSSCVDVTDATESSCVWSEDRFDGPYVRCNHTTPSGARMRSSNSCTGPGNTYDTLQRGAYDTLWNASTVERRRRSAITADSMLMSAILIPPFRKDDNEDCTQQTRPQSAYECSITWCAHTYQNTEVRNGSLVNEPAHSSPLVFMNSHCQNENGTGPFNFRQTIRTEQYTTGSEQITITIDTNNVPAFKTEDIPVFECPEHPNMANMPDAEAEAIKASTRALESRLETAPNAFIINGANQDFIELVIAQTFSGGYRDTSTMAGYEVDLTLAVQQGLYEAHRNGTFPQTIDKIVAALTQHIRTGPNSTLVEGTVQESDTLIRVSWPWMTLPISLVLFTVLFFGASVVFSAETHRIVWKSSALATLFHGLSGWNEEQTDYVSLKAMGRRAESMRASLAVTPNGNLKLMRRDG